MVAFNGRVPIIISTGTASSKAGPTGKTRSCLTEEDIFFKVQLHFESILYFISNMPITIK